MKKKDLPLIFGLVILFIGIFLPAIKIANENISFLKENGLLAIIIFLIMFVLYKLDKKKLMLLPAVTFIGVIIKFVFDNRLRLQQINQLYECYADFRYGLVVMLLGNVIIIFTILIMLFSSQKVWLFVKEKVVAIKGVSFNVGRHLKKVGLFLISKCKDFALILKEKISSFKIKKELNKDVVAREKTNDGVIKYNKLVVKLNSKDKKVKEHVSLFDKVRGFITNIRLKKCQKLSVSKFNDSYKNNDVKVHRRTYNVPVIDIRKWTRNDVCCVNCGATVSSNSEYCFLCDCKVKLSDKQEKLS